ncbi:Cysteine-rich receptor-like protein kinase 10, partial [Mucuna pruriens]
MASYKTILILFFLNFAITEAQDDLVYQSCPGEKTTANTSFQFDVTNLLSDLASHASGHTQFYSTISNDANPSDSIHGLFMCRGDVSMQPCQQCVLHAIHTLNSSEDCSLSKEAMTWYEECMVRYSTTNFFSNEPMAFCNTANVSNPKFFMHLLSMTMNQTAEEAMRAPKKFATLETNVSEFQTLYCLAQCTPNLQHHDCRTCLSEAIGNISNSVECHGVRLGGKVLCPSCNIRYESYPFYTDPSSTPPPNLVAETKTSNDADSTFSQDPIYLSHNCSSNKTFTGNSTFQKCLKTLFSFLSSNATTKIFHEADVSNKVYGLFMCRGDIDAPSGTCEKCVQNATHRIALDCNSSQEAIIWYSQCMLRYSNRSFFKTVERRPMFSELNITSNDKEQSFFTVTLAATLDKVAVEAGDSAARYGKKLVKLNDLQTLYTLAQCTQDLSTDECKSCLGYVIGTEIPWSRLGSIGGRVLYPSCNLRFELSQFYKDDDEAPSARPGSPESSGKRKSILRTIMLVAVPTIISVKLFIVAYYFLRRNRRKSHTTILKENFGHEVATLEPLHFNLTTIELATNNFSEKNKIGKGGFGEVYKGILFDGRQIAVKRLSKNSKQGATEFKTEVLLIAKLQHRNLVEFIGFCLEEQEKILIYEYVPNKSLDHFLFDSQKQKLLSWSERYKIIGGIARAILYLHEHSRLKVIHRDLKPSNILLDESMTPKISDFGIAKIIEIDQDQESTDLIVGTYGYMSPEYVMLGQFSEKSDIFSFGVMVLEIITGKKNMRSHEQRGVADSLPSYVWKKWRAQTPLSTLDPNIKENCAEIEVIKCIQIGLLCIQQNPDARPTMVTIVSYLDSHFSELPTPLEPAFFFQGKMEVKRMARKLSSKKSINISTSLSMNEMSISAFLPR